jgi:hypothetical protein
MKERKILGVRCNVVGPGMFPPRECVVKVAGKHYLSWEDNLGLTDEVPKKPYVKVICGDYSGRKKSYLVGISSAGDFINVRAKESDLVFA